MDRITNARIHAGFKTRRFRSPQRELLDDLPDMGKVIVNWRALTNSIGDKGKLAESDLYGVKYSILAEIEKRQC